MRHLFVVLLLQAWPALAQARDVSARCRRPCEAHLPDARSRAACLRCGLDQEPMGWLFKAPQVPAGAFIDADWLVRWSAVRADAKLKGSEPERLLAQLIEGSDDERRRHWCATALLAAGARTSTRDVFLAKEPKALSACRSIDGPAYGLAAAEVLQPDTNRALEALQAIAAARGTGPARVALDLMIARGEGVDEVVGNLLVVQAERGGPPVGLTLLRDATERDTAQVDRLLALYSRLRDRSRPLLSSSEKDARRQAISALAPLAPLSSAELLVGLDDQQASIRMAAARALARGEGRSLTEAAEARLSGATPASPAERRRWLTLLADVDDPACEALTRRTWRDETQPDMVRAEALVSLAGCSRRAALPELTAAASLRNVTLQAGVMRAVLLLPREPGVVPLVEAALTSTSDAVLAGAAQAIGAHRLTTLGGQLPALLEHEAPGVRAESLRALAALDPRKAQPLVIARLEQDQDVAVRSAAAELLADVGGPIAVAALARASKRDPDPSVKVAATASLRRLGVTP
ncbi:MAG: HEAT repeat domain-containing protein [Myxococcaceae bacterium]|nr:HEAT repeat domain-containing protein [Myxococcaceae bacterium]